MKSINEINIETKEGKYLLMALAALTVSEKISLNGVIRNGMKMTPDEVLIEVGKAADKSFNIDKEDERSVATED
jgi:hypothetical protein